MDFVEFERRRRAAQRRWMFVSGSVPGAILVGQMFYGTLGGMVYWMRVSQPLFFAVIAGIVALRLTRTFWLQPWTKPGEPADIDMERIENNAYKFLHVAWGFAAALALMGLVMFLLGADLVYPYVFELLSITYFLIYYPRRTLFAALWGKQTLI